MKSPQSSFILSATAVVALLWLPFGFHLGGNLEEWDLLYLFSRHGPFLVTGSASPLPWLLMRPLTIVPQAVAFALDPNSFVFWHVLLMLSLVIKCSAASAIIWWLTQSRRWALFFGMLVVLYPADTMQLSFRSLHINFSVSLILLAAALQLNAFQKHSLVSKLLLQSGAVLCLITSSLMYEAALFLTPLPIVLVLMRPTAWRRLWTQRWQTFSWVLAASLCVVYLVYALAHGATYQVSVIGTASLTGTISERFPKLFSIAAPRALAGGWFDAGGIVLTEFQHYGYLVAALVACVALIRFLGKESGVTGSATPYQRPLAEFPLARMAVLGFTLLILGYLPYLTSNAHLHITQRTYLFAAPGSALVWLALLIGIDRLNRYLSTSMGTLILLLGLGAQLFQFHHYQSIFDTQRNIVRQIVENLPDIASDKHLLLLDASAKLNHTWMLRDELIYVLTYFYGKPVDHIEICLQPGNYWPRLDKFGRAGGCVETPKSWVFRTASPVSGPGMPLTEATPDLEIPKAKMVLVRINRDGTVTPTPETAANRARLAAADDIPSQRYRNILKSAPWPIDFKLFYSRKSQSSYRWDFGRWWNLDIPPQGTGWKDAEWQVGSFRHISYAWKTQPYASLLFDLEPTNGDYLLTGRFLVFASPQIRDSLRIQVNGHNLPYRLGSKGTFISLVPAGRLLSGPNAIEFISPVDVNVYGLAASLDWVSLQPREHHAGEGSASR